MFHWPPAEVTSRRGPVRVALVFRGPSWFAGGWCARPGVHADGVRRLGLTQADACGLHPGASPTKPSAGA